MRSVSVTKETSHAYAQLNLMLSLTVFRDTHVRSHFSSASENTTSASFGRLNNPDDAWCFLYERVSATDRVSFTVDLGSPHLVSGFQSQGPPRNRHGEDYLRYVGLKVRLSMDGIRWRDQNSLVK